MKIEQISKREVFDRKVQGIAAALLPYEQDGRIAVEAFQRHVQFTDRAGLMNAVNMDTGYVNYLSEPEKLEILRWTRDALDKDTAFVSGAYIEGQSGDLVELYRRQMDAIVDCGGIPILFQTSRLHGKSTAEKISVYQGAARGYVRVLAFELGSMFAPNGEIFDEETFVGIMNIPEIQGLKHSSLDRIVELRRLSLRDKHRPDFRIYTGNDLGINMIEYGSDYLLGLATFAPEKFAQHDRLWESGDAGYFALSDALQYLGNTAFRAPVPAYKHSAAVFLHALGRIPSSLTHLKSAKRPDWEAEIMRGCAQRLGYEVTGRRSGAA
jgi:dihydrodipicolinate synthase/N-acetylneuraminate lyase